jgi:hypothetical protein
MTILGVDVIVALPMFQWNRRVERAPGRSTRLRRILQAMVVER